MKNYLKSDYELFLNKNSSIVLFILTEEIARFGHMLLSIIRLFTNFLITLFIFIFIFYNYPNQLTLLFFQHLLAVVYTIFQQEILLQNLVLGEL